MTVSRSHLLDEVTPVFAPLEAPKWGLGESCAERIRELRRIPLRRPITVVIETVRIPNSKRKDSFFFFWVLF